MGSVPFNSETFLVIKTANPMNWFKIAFLAFTPILGIPVLAIHTYYSGFEWWMPALFFSLYCLTGLCICAGYHRYYSHRSYECSKLVQLFYAVFGAMSIQNSILQWSSGHRRHHAHAESEWDPYSIKRGFWWAHIIWIFHDDNTAYRQDNVRDLAKDPIVKWQDKWYMWIVILGGFGFPTLVGWLMGNAVAGLLWGGFLRIILVHHSTFFVNSLAHYFGEPTYDENATARDNWAVALLTFGEGYHSFHHRFPSDFRNGVRWFAWDPAKWFISTLKLLGMAHKLNATAAPKIEKARMKAAIKRVEARIAQAEPSISAELRERIQRAHDAFDSALELWRKQAKERKAGLDEQWEETRKMYRTRLKQARREWREVLRAYKALGSTDESPAT